MHMAMHLVKKKQRIYNVQTARLFVSRVLPSNMHDRESTCIFFLLDQAT